MNATLRNIATGELIAVSATAMHPASSYGHYVWVDADNNAYCEVGAAHPLYEEVSTDITFGAEFGQWVRNKRISQGISLRKLAEMADTTLSTIQSIEAGEHAPRMDILTKVLSALGRRLTV